MVPQELMLSGSEQISPSSGPRVSHKASLGAFLCSPRLDEFSSLASRHTASRLPPDQNYRRIRSSDQPTSSSVPGSCVLGLGKSSRNSFPFQDLAAPATVLLQMGAAAVVFSSPMSLWNTRSSLRKVVPIGSTPCLPSTLHKGTPMTRAHTATAARSWDRPERLMTLVCLGVETRQWLFRARRLIATCLWIRRTLCQSNLFGILT